MKLLLIILLCVPFFSIAKAYDQQTVLDLSHDELSEGNLKVLVEMTAFLLP